MKNVVNSIKNSEFLMKYNEKILKILFILIVSLMILIVGILVQPSRSVKLDDNIILSINSDKYRYLSDLDFITTNNWSYNGWGDHEIQKDRNQEGGSLSLIVDSTKRTFAKGLSVHAKGQVTFDISELSTKFPRFLAYLGVDASRGVNGSIWYEIFVSNDGTNWISLLKTDIFTGNTKSLEIDLNVEGYRYLRIYVDPNGGNGADHGTIGNARLVTKDFDKNIGDYERLRKVEYYDELLKEHDFEYNYNNNYDLVLEREFVNKFGFWTVQDAVSIDAKMVKTLDWILDNEDVMEQIIEVGEIANGSLFLRVLSDLYYEYESALNSSNGFVYLKMMVGLAAAYSTDRVISPLAFSFQSPTTYNYMERFRIMKDFFDNDKFKRVKVNALAGEFVLNDWFKDYHVQLMRMVMQDGTSNGDLVWLNGFTNEKQSVSFYMIPYVSPVYTQDKYYSEDNRAKYEELYYLSKYNVSYGLTNGVKVPRYWMVFANGGICWNASRVGQSMYRVNGIPATGAYQPGHELYIQYYQDNNGNGYWTPRYGNWGWAGSTWGGANPYRYIFNWGAKYFADKHISGGKGASSTGYLYLGQANLNRLELYQKSLYYNLIANSYTDNNQKLKVYFESLKVNDLNLDTYDYIINIYKAMSVKNEGGTITSHEWYELANKIIDAYKFYPVAMSDLLNVIRPYLEGTDKLYIDRLEKDTLLRASRATAADTIQVDGVRTHANQLLNKAQPDPMTFSFDGDNAGKIIKNPIYSLAWGYSLDGGNTFTEFKMDDEITLSSEELASITAENDIIINFMGLTNYTFRIDITNGVLSNLLFANDLENRVVGIDLTYEWRNSESDAWTSYRVASPNNIGNKTLYVRRGATGVQLPSNSVTYTFTEDNQPFTRKYVPVSHLSIKSVSTEAVNNAGSANYAIDGNYNTRWHSAWNGSDTERFIVIELDKSRYISAIEFVPAGGGNGKIIDGIIYGSLNGDDWFELASAQNLTYTNQANNNDDAIKNTKSFEVTDPQEVKFIKVVASRASNGNWFTARNFNIFQDLTKNPRPTAGIGYSTNEPTRENVVARLVNISTDNYEILSPGGDTHLFTDNGEFTFEFRDLNTGLIGTSKAVVNWIDRTIPTGQIEYSKKTSTNQSVIAILKPSEEVTVINNGEYKIDEDGNILDNLGNILNGFTADSEGNVKDPMGSIVGNLNTFRYEFLDNGEFTFEFVDKAGNIGSATATVDWIDYDAPFATLNYNITSLTNNDVTLTLDFNERVIIKNNGGSNVYTFTDNGEITFDFQDMAGNKGTITAVVDWIDKTAPTAKLSYKKTNKNTVVVKVVDASEEITFLDNSNGVYEFDTNGNYEITFYDKAGNMGKLIAIVDGLKTSSLDKPKPEEPSVPDKPVDSDKPTNPNGNVNKPIDGNVSNSGNGNTINNSNNGEQTDKVDTNNNSNNKPSNNGNNDNKPNISGDKNNNVELDKSIDEHNGNGFINLILIIVGISLTLCTILVAIRKGKINNEKM